MLQNVKSTIATIAILGLIGLGVGVGASADTEVGVSATVTAQVISVIVDDGAVAYGILPLNTTKNTTVSELDDTQQATSTSNVEVDLGIRSSDAVGGTPWDLVASVGSIDQFTHEFSIDDGGNWTAFDVDNVSNSTLVNTLAPNGDQTFDLRIGTPTSVTDNVEKTITVTVQATASS